MKRTTSQRSNKSRSKSKNKEDKQIKQSQEQPQLKKQASKKNQEEEKIPKLSLSRANSKAKNQQNQNILVPIYTQGQFLLIHQEGQQPFVIELTKNHYAEDKEIEGHIYVEHYAMKKKEQSFVRNANDPIKVNVNSIAGVVDRQIKKRVKKNQSQAAIFLKKQIKDLIKTHKKHQKELKKLEKKNKKQQKNIKKDKEEIKANGGQNKRRKLNNGMEQMEMIQPKYSNQQNGQFVQNKRQRNAIDIDMNQDIEEVEKKASQKKRDKKQQSKQAKAKKADVPAQQINENVEIPSEEDILITSQEPLTDCCQTCSNRNCIRAVEIDSVDLMIHCVKARAYVSSLIEHLAPERRFSALELAIKSNNVKILEVLLAQDKPEKDYRMPKRQTQIEKFETGEVGQMAFGYKVRKVQMMRGNRQGNNAFLEDPIHEHQTPIDFLLNNEFCIEKSFSQDGISLQTFRVIEKELKKDKFEEYINTKVLPILLGHGCTESLKNLFELLGKANDFANSFFNQVYYELLFAKEDCKITEADFQKAKPNKTANYAHVAALNQYGKGLKYLIDNGIEIDVTVEKRSTAHYAAVCKSDVNLKILIDQEIDLHDQDTNKRTPLMWSIKSKASYEVSKTLMDELNKTQMNIKDDQRQQAVHYLCKYGVNNVNSQEILQLFLDNKLSFTTQGGYNKYTPLCYASTYNHYEIVEFILTNAPRININKGDKYNRTPLLMACKNGNLRIVCLLLRHNADIQLSDTSDNSPLHYAAAYGWIEIVRILLKYGANPSAGNAWKSTPLTIALQKNHTAIVRELIQAQELDVESKDDDGRTVLTLAMANITRESIDLISELIINKKADVNTQDAKGRTPLYHLVFNMSQRKRGLFDDHDEFEHKIVKMLISSGANLNIKAKDGKSPFSIAFEHGMTELLKIFGGNIDLNQDPTLFFVFQGVNILKPDTYNLLKECLTTKQIEDETINYVNDQGFTPYLYYIKEFCLSKQRIIAAINDLCNSKVKKIDTNVILASLDKQQNQNLLFVNPTKEVNDIFKQHIVEPFIAFLQILLDSGANPNAYVLKLKQWRDEVISSAQGLSQISSQAAQALARRPAEKDQYVTEVLGLCNAIHILLDTPIIELFDFLIAIKGIDLNQVNFQKMSPFFKLVKTKDIKNDQIYKHCFEALLKTGKVDIDSPDQFGMSAFWYFYTNNRIDEAFYLVDKGANINHIDNYGVFALKRELFQNNFQMLQRLLDKGVNPNMSDEFQRTVMHLSCDFAHRRDYKEIFKLFIKHKASVSQPDFKNRTPIHYMFVKKNKRNACDQYDPLAHGLDIILTKETIQDFDINQQDINGKAILHYAAQRGSIQSLEYLIKLFAKEKINFSIEDKFQNTPLSVAINTKHFGFVEKLLEYIDLDELKGFIYQEPARQLAQQQNVFQFGGGMQQQDDEQSDMEYMQVQAQDLPKEQPKKQKRDENAVNLFRYIIRNNLQQLEKLFIEKGYDRIQMVVDYICEGQINKLFQVIDTHFKNMDGAKGSILIQKNNKEQNLIHVLARNAHLMKDITELTKFYKQLVDQGVNPFEPDYKGRTALHFAVKSGNIHFIKFLVDVEKFDVNTTDQKGANALVHLLKGDRILKANEKILQYLLKNDCNPNQLYEEEQYQSKYLDKNEEQKLQDNYKCTPVIHAIRHESKDRSHIRVVLKEILEHADPSQQDSDGKDAFFYSVIRNHYNTFNFILDTIHDQQQSYDSIKKDTVDKQGKSLIHYVVNPLPFGSFENDDLLRKAIEVGFKWDIKDNKGKTPYEYSKLQKSGVLQSVFEEVLPNVKNEFKQNDKDEPMDIDQLLDGVNQQQPLNHQQYSVDFEKDAQSYLQEIQMQIDPHNYVPCDPSGKFNDDCIVMYDDDTEQHFDVYLTHVEIGKFQPGGDYIFYKMQLVLDKSRDLPILLTRWGRIGEEGAFQKTPFNSHELAIAEFKKIFEQKTSNKWGKKDNFHKKFRKFQLMRTNYVTIDQKNYLMPLNLDQAPASQILSKDGLEILREICDVNTYLKALQASGVDPKAMPFSNLDRKNLYNAQDILEKLEKTLQKIEGMNPRPYAENERNKLLALREKMWYLSSRFYEFIPHEEFRNKMVPPISNMNLLVQKSAMIQSLIQIEMASKMLLGALYKQQEMNPLDYCIKATGLKFETLGSQDPEYKIIREYAENTYVDAGVKKQIKNIIRLTQANNKQPFQDNTDNKMLLFHGSKVSCFLGILAQGLRVQPIEVQRNGNLLGKGIYFSDMISKSMQYTHDQNASNHGSRFVLVCEVALGQPKKFTRQNNNYVLEEGYNSVLGEGRQGPDRKVMVTLPDGSLVCLGKVINQEGKANSDFQYNEYVVSDPSQVRMRYLIQFK